MAPCGGQWPKESTSDPTYIVGRAWDLFWGMLMVLGWGKKGLVGVKMLAQKGDWIKKIWVGTGKMA